MTVQAGKDVLLKLGDGASPEVFTSAAGLRMKSIALNARSVDVTHADSPAGWRELLGGAGVKTCSISGAGVFAGEAADHLVRQHFFAQSVAQWQVIIPAFARLSGPFIIAALDYSGRHDGEAAWSLTLSSAGELAVETL